VVDEAHEEFRSCHRANELGRKSSLSKLMQVFRIRSRKRWLAVAIPIFVAVALLGTLAPMVTVDASGRVVSVMGITVTSKGDVSIQSDIVLAAQTDDCTTCTTTHQSIDYRDYEVGDVSKFAYVEIEPSGCQENHGNVEVRYAFYLKPGAARYDEQHVYVIDETSSEFLKGYPGKVDEQSSPVNQTQYDKWIEKLPRIWKNNPFHNHFVNFDVNVTNEEIIAAGNYHLANFYEAWRLNKTIRSGWDVRTRAPPVKYDETDDISAYEIRKTQCEQRVDEIKSLSITTVLGLGEGKTFPATAIDVGSAAIDRDTTFGSPGYTLINWNNLANETGSLDTFELWFEYSGGNPTGVKVGTFYFVTPNFVSRDVETIGNVTAGSKQTFSGLSCDVTSDGINGDAVGLYWATTGKLEHDTSGYDGCYYKSGDQFGTGAQSYTNLGGDAASIYATGDTCAEDISNTPASKDFGTVEAGTSYWSKGSAPTWPLDDAECNFTVTNNSCGAVNITVKATNFTGGSGWTLTSGSPGNNTVRLKVGKSGDASEAAMVVLTTSYQSFISGLADGGTKKWELKMESPSSFSDGAQKTSTITLSATCV